MKDNATSRPVVVNNLLFGGITKSSGDGDNVTYETILYTINIMISFIMCQMWKTSKWIEIRFKTRHVEQFNWWRRFQVYLDNREMTNNMQTNIQGKLKFANLTIKKDEGAKKKVDKRAEKQVKKKKREKFDGGSKSTALKKAT